MNEEEFIKEHPGLKGKGWIVKSFEPMKVTDETMSAEICAIYETPVAPKAIELLDFYGINNKVPRVYDINIIRETQLDKAKVKEVLKKLVQECKTEYGFSCDFAPKLMKELGLK